MGANVEISETRDEGGESIGTITARPSRLRGTEINAAEVPALIDELPLFACVAARAQGDSIVRGASELRVKESDRIATIVSNLQLLGVDAEELPDGFRVSGSGKELSGRIETKGDHRIAMSFGVLGGLAGNQIEMDNPGCVAVSYPEFWKELSRVRQ
jgi:3-phosphoshikimate 1-carboxyvinyltransferase